MNKKLQIVLNEYQTIKELRERCIKNIEESTRTYLQFLALSSIAGTAFLNCQDLKLLLQIVIFLVIIVGIFIYYFNVQSHITFIKYTRSLNQTRKLFVKFGVPKNYFELPIDEKWPPFDELGYIGKKFSKNGSLRIIQSLNSLFAGILVFYFLNTYILIENWIKVSHSLIFALLTFSLHNIFNDNLVQQAKDKFN